jgi:hypothetical protein
MMIFALALLLEPPAASEPAPATTAPDAYQPGWDEEPVAPPPTTTATPAPAPVEAPPPAAPV